MSPKTIGECKKGVSRAIRNAQWVLLRNDLDPFEFVVEIREAPVDDGKTTYVLEISTTDSSVRTVCSSPCVVSDSSIFPRTRSSANRRQ